MMFATKYKVISVFFAFLKKDLSKLVLNFWTQIKVLCFLNVVCSYKIDKDNEFTDDSIIEEAVG